MRMILFCLLVFSGVAFGQGLPPGTYKGSRVCSDGSAPQDLIRNNPIFLSVHADGTYSSSADLFSGDSDCTELTSGHFLLANGFFVSTNEKREKCGRCKNRTEHSPGSVVRTSAKILSDGFFLRMFSNFGEGGSCLPGQQMLLNFKRVNDAYEDLSKSCDPVEAF